MIAICPRCGAETDWTPTSEHTVEATRSSVSERCSILKERLIEGSVENFDCPEMREALAEAVARYRHDDTG